MNKEEIMEIIMMLDEGLAKEGEARQAFLIHDDNVDLIKLGAHDDELQ